MIIKEIKSDMIHIYSNKGLKLLVLQTGEIISEANEKINGVHYNYVEYEKGRSM